VVRFFFDNLLPINGLSDLERDKSCTRLHAGAGRADAGGDQRLLDYEIFEGGGTWPRRSTAPYTFLNGPLAAFYKVPGVPGWPSRRCRSTERAWAVITQASMLAGHHPLQPHQPGGARIVRRPEAAVHEDPAARRQHRREGQAARSLLGQDRARALHQHQQDPSAAAATQSMDPSASRWRTSMPSACTAARRTA
jgi:hypothetical protein